MSSSAEKVAEDGPDVETLTFRALTKCQCAPYRHITFWYIPYPKFIDMIRSIPPKCGRERPVQEAETFGTLRRESRPVETRVYCHIIQDVKQLLQHLTNAGP